MARTPKKKTLADFEKQRAKRNETQRLYRQRNQGLCEVWKQRSYRNYLVAHGWKCEPPEGFPTLDEARTRRDLLRILDSDPIDLSDFDYSEIADNLDPEDFPL